MWLLGFELRTFGRAVECSYPLSHLTSPLLFLYTLMFCLHIYLCKSVRSWLYSYKLPCGYWDLNPGPEQLVPLTAEPSFQPHIFGFFLFFFSRSLSHCPLHLPVLSPQWRVRRIYWKHITERLFLHKKL